MPNRHIMQLRLVMRLTTVILMALLLQISATTLAQNLSLDQKEVPLEKIFREIHNQTGYDFLYDSDLLDTKKRVTIKIIGASIEEVLNKCLENQALVFSIEDRTIFIKQKSTLLINPFMDIPKAVAIGGRVVDESGNPLADATIKLKNTLKGTISNAKGEFSMENLDERAILQINYVGYRGLEVSAASLKENSVVKLEVAVGVMDEVSVVSTGYQFIPTERLTGSTATITKEQYESPITANNFLLGIQNRLPGVLINNDLKFEGNSLFQIRGISTISANKQPLVVVDGYPTELSLNAINPNEIESVTVLKDAAAAAIYGVRASNGVIIVERKKAVSGNSKVAFRTTLSVTPKEDYNTYRFAPPSAQMRYHIDSYDRRGSYTRSFYSSSSQRYPSGYEPIIDLASGLITREEMEKRMSEQYAYNNASDYSKLFEQNRITQQYDLNLSGGTSRAFYFISSNFTSNQHAKIKNNDERFLLSGRGTYNFSNNLSFMLTTDFTQTRYNSVPVRDLQDFYTFERFQDDHGNPLPTQAGSITNPLYNPGIIARGYLDNLNYPLREINEVRDESKTTTNRIMGDLSYTIIPGLSVKLGGVYERSNNNAYHYASEHSSEIKQLVNRYSEVGTDGVIRFNLPKGGFSTSKIGTITGYTLRSQVNYDKEFGPAHALKVITGGEVRKISAELDGFAYFGYNEQTLLHQPVDYHKIFTRPWFNSAFPLGERRPLRYDDLFHKAFSDDRYVSAYMNGVYTYKSKFSFSGSIRIDQSNLFGTDPKYKYKPLWALGAAWNIDREKFMADIGWLDLLKIRVSKGFNGNVSKESLPQIIAAYTHHTGTIPVSTALNISGLENSGLRWEQTDNFNVGIDFRIFERIRGSMDYYSKRSTDLLGNTAIDPTKGASFATLNAAKIDNSGLEVNLNANWLQSRQFNWNTGIVFSFNQSKVRDIYQNSQMSSIYYVDGSALSNFHKGYPVGSLFSFRFAGLNENGMPTVYDKDQNVKELVFSNDEGFDDLEYSGNSIPTCVLGISNRLDIGPFYLYAMVDFYTGFKTRIPRPIPNAFRPQAGAENYFRKPGDQAVTDVMGVSEINTSVHHRFSVYNNSDKYVVDGSYLLLREVTVSYKLNTQMFKKIGFTNFEVRMQGSNLFTKGFNKYNFSGATGSFLRRNLVPTFTLGLFINI